VTNITFIFESSPNTKPIEKNVRWTWHISSPPPEKVWGDVPHVPHLIAPMTTIMGHLHWSYLNISTLGMQLGFMHIMCLYQAKCLLQSNISCSTAIESYKDNILKYMPFYLSQHDTLH